MSLRTTLFAMVYDRFMAKTEKSGLHDMRAELLTSAKGDVLEIGAGTGANLSLYGPNVRSLTVTEPEPPMVKRLEQHAKERAPQTTVLRAPAEDLPFEDNSFDTVVSTLVLCGVSDQPRALRELRRVLRPDGELLFLEHVRSDDPKLAKTQNHMNGVNRAMVGCECNRPTLDSIKAAGFDVTKVEPWAMPNAPKFIRPAIVGTARVASSVPSGGVA